MFDAGSNQSLATQLLGMSVGEAFGGAVIVDELPCRLVDPEVFFAEQPADVEYAKSLCRECPVQESCLEGALERREPWGVWGGELLVQGEVVARKRPRGRPRKNPLPEPEVAPAAQHLAELLARRSVQRELQHVLHQGRTRSQEGPDQRPGRRPARIGTKGGGEQAA